MKRLMMIIATGLVVVLNSALLPMSVGASAAANAVLNGADAANGDGPSVDNAIAVGVNSLSLLVGLASVVMIILGGYKYITSAGDAGKTTAARSTVIYACVGLAIVAVAQVILRFVVAKVRT